MIPGEVRVGTEPLDGRPDAERVTLVAVNTGDRPIQVGSHLHLPAANRALHFDRQAAEGFRLDVPAGTSVRFEPGVSREVTLVRLGGRGFVPGPRGIGTSTAPGESRPADRVVPHGTPGVPVKDPERTLAVPTRMSEDDGVLPHDEEDVR